MINGVRVRDSGVELSPTGTDLGEARERHPTARFELLRHSRPDRRDGSCRRTKRPLSASLEESTRPPGHPWPPFYSQVAHCYALVKNLHARIAHGLPAAFPGRLRHPCLTCRPLPGSAPVTGSARREPVNQAAWRREWESDCRRSVAHTRT